MLVTRTIAMVLLFIPPAITISYMDVRYRRIPNKLVFIIFIGGLVLNTVYDGWNGLLGSMRHRLWFDVPPSSLWHDGRRGRQALCRGWFGHWRYPRAADADGHRACGRGACCIQDDSSAPGWVNNGWRTPGFLRPFARPGSSTLFRAC